MRDMQKALDVKHGEVKEKQAAIQASQDQVARLQSLLRDSQINHDRLQKEFNLLNDKVHSIDCSTIMTWPCPGLGLKL